MIRYLLLICVLLLSGLTALAQDSDDDTMTVYYEDENPNQLDSVLLWKNVCLERFIQLNPDIDITHIDYGQKMQFPVDEPCYQREGESWDFAYNTPFRLKYFENNEWLDEPYYTDNIAYSRDMPIEAMARLNGVCVEDLLADNILLHDFQTYEAFTNFTTMDIFLPTGEPSCDLSNNLYPDGKLIVIHPQYIYFSPRYFSQEFNICPEEIPRWSSFLSERIELPWSLGFEFKNIQSCYDDEGQRLSYYDEFGNKLSVPIYSDLSIYIAPAGETLDTIAQKFDVCLIDVLRLNGFPIMPMIGDVEIFIPPSRSCPLDIKTIQTQLSYLQDISWDTNICEDILSELNPQLQDIYPYRYPKFNFSYESRNKTNHWIIVPVEHTPCYGQYNAQKDESLYDIEQLLNICHEAFESKGNIHNKIIKSDNTMIYFPLDSLPCFNDEGQRLYYPPQEFTWYTKPKPPHPYYTDMPQYILERGDNAFSISKQFNVCVRDLLETNEELKSSMIVGLRIFIPDTRPCYDDVTSMPLIYEGEDGRLLDEPQIADQLKYYGGESLGHISRYYNVCQNRIRNANRAKLDRETSYLGWIIPTDRPPCMDADGNLIGYVCYTQAIDMTVDYRDSDETITFDVDGTDCHDLSNPETVVWYQNEAYKAIYYRDTILKSRAFTAWCYDVSLDEINSINAQEDVLEMIPLYTLLIPQPTRDCYVEIPEILEKHSTIHMVRAGETLTSISKIYNKPYLFIAHANDLDGNNTIWAGQQLIIPDGFTWSDIWMMVACISCFGLWIGLLTFRKRHYSTKKKGMPKKREVMEGSL